MKQTFTNLFIFNFLWIISTLQAATQQMADCHFHMLNFLQNGEFDNSDGKYPANSNGVMEDGRFFQIPAGERHRRITGLLKIVEAHHLEDVIVCGMPFVKKWAENEFFQRPKYYLDSTSRVVPARDSDLAVAAAFHDFYQKYGNDTQMMRAAAKVHPFICALDTTDLGAVDLAVKRIREYPGIWEGMGELMSRHDDLTNLTAGERPRGNHSSLIRLFKFAGLVSLPISIHHNVAPISRSEKEIKSPLYLGEFRDLLKRTIDDEPSQSNRPTVIWCHSGISRRLVISDYHNVLREILEQYSTYLFMDISWVVLETYIYENLDTWVELIEDYPNNFILGSDAVGSYSSIPFEMRRYTLLLDSLSPITREKIAHKNLAAILNGERNKRTQKGFGIGGITLPEDFQIPDTFGLEHLQY